MFSLVSTTLSAHELKAEPKPINDRQIPTSGPRLGPLSMILCFHESCRASTEWSRLGMDRGPRRDEVRLRVYFAEAVG